MTPGRGSSQSTIKQGDKYGISNIFYHNFTNVILCRNGRLKLKRQSYCVNERDLEELCINECPLPRLPVNYIVNGEKKCGKRKKSVWKCSAQITATWPIFMSYFQVILYRGGSLSNKCASQACSHT